MAAFDSLAFSEDAFSSDAFDMDSTPAEETAKGGYYPHPQKTYKKIKKRKSDEVKEWNRLRRELTEMVDPSEKVSKKVKQEAAVVNQVIPPTIPKSIPRPDLRQQIAQLEGNLERLKEIGRLETIVRRRREAAIVQNYVQKEQAQVKARIEQINITAQSYLRRLEQRVEEIKGSLKRIV